MIPLYVRKETWFEKLKDDLKWTVKLYSLTLVIPLTLSIMNILFVGILGIEAKYTFWELFEVIWIDYYITGHILSLAAWRIQLCILVLSFFITRLK